MRSAKLCTGRHHEEQTLALPSTPICLSCCACLSRALVKGCRARLECHRREGAPTPPAGCRPLLSRVVGVSEDCRQSCAGDPRHHSAPVLAAAAALGLRHHRPRRHRPGLVGPARSGACPQPRPSGCLDVRVHSDGAPRHHVHLAWLTAASFFAAHSLATHTPPCASAVKTCFSCGSPSPHHKTQLRSDWGRRAPQVGLSLSLFVLLDRQIADARFRSLAVFFMGAQALLTLVVQGTTMPWLLQARRATADVLCCPRWLDRHPPCSSCTGLDGDCYLCGVRRWLGSRHGAA